ncbi:hypothetical protein D9757_014145 [Collybiopsis confluens]|uniref:Uncharacterized protein n=1 Tax=Collybiopsis confluens TaxID=2823264 RepID=A0A8H5FQ39_9AGAR|nr:hypothetical protein D9757_014145 [Collybiopsis confluens]
MFKIKWKGRKKSRSDADLRSDMRALTGTTKNPLKVVTLKRPRAASIPLSTADDKIRPLSTIPSSPTPNSTTIDLDPAPAPAPFPRTSNHGASIATSPRSKVERTLGGDISSNISAVDSSNSVGETRTSGVPNRRLSMDSSSPRRNSVARSLSSIGSFLWLPKSSSQSRVDIDSEYALAEEVCWVDNEYDASLRDGMQTPVSPMVFSERAPSPLPPPRPKALMGPRPQPGRSLVITTGSETSDEGSEDELHSLVDAPPEPPSPECSLSDSGVPDTPLSFTCEAMSPTSSIVFSQQPLSPLFPSTSASNRTDTLLALEKPSSELPQSLSTHPSYARPFSPDSTSVITSDLITDSPTRSSLLLPPRSQRELRNASGQWNRTDIQEVIRGLRELK